MKPRELGSTSAVQLNPHCKHPFAGCYMTVARQDRWNVQGYVTLPGRPGARGLLALTACEYRCLERVGPSPWPEEGAT